MKLVITKDIALILILLVVIGGVYWYSRAHVMTYDEYRDLYLAKMIMKGQYSYFGDAFYLHPPLYMTLLAISSTIFGYGEDAGYVVSIAFALATMFVAYLFVSKFLNKKIAFVTAIILAFSPWFAHFARDMRFEMATTFFLFASVYLFWRYFETKNFKLLILTGITIGLGLLVKSFLFLIYPAILLFVLILWKQKRFKLFDGIKIIFIIGIISLLVYSPWIIYTSINNGPSQIQAQWEQFTGKVSWYPNYVVPPFYFYFLQLPSILTWPVLILSLIGIYYAIKNIKDGPLLILLWIVVFLLLVSVMGYKEQRFITYLIPGFVVFAAMGIENLSQKTKAAQKSVFMILIAVVVLIGLVSAERPVWQADTTLKNWDLWDYIAKNISKNEYIPTNNYAAAELYSNPSDYLIKDWSVDRLRFLSMDSEYALIEPDVQYPLQYADIFTTVKSFQFTSLQSTTNLTLYKIDLQKLSSTLYGNNSIAVQGSVKNIFTSDPIFRAKILIADYNSKQLINVFYTKPDGSFTAFLPSYGTYIIQSDAFGFGTINYAVIIDANSITICTSSTNCMAKNKLDISLPFKSYIVHGYPSSRY